MTFTHYDDPNHAICSRCGDFYYLRDQREDVLYVCPDCSCPTCQRLKHVSPELGGCTCQEFVPEKYEGRDCVEQPRPERK